MLGAAEISEAVGAMRGEVVSWPVAAGHRKPEQLAPAVADHKERKQTLECHCRNYAEINRRDGMRMIVQERPPAL